MALITNISTANVVVLDAFRKEYKIAVGGSVTIDNSLLTAESFEDGVTRGWITVSGYVPPKPSMGGATAPALPAKASLPDAEDNKGAFTAYDDEGVAVPVFSDGSNWKGVDTSALV